MSLKTIPQSRTSSEINAAIIIAIIIGIGVALGIIIFEIRTERFSSVYIYPESYSNYPEIGTMPFTYGIHSYEKEKTGYVISIFVGDTLVDTKEITLMPDEIYEEKKVIRIPEDSTYPLKISLNYESPHEKNEVHFWLKDDGLERQER